MAYGTIRKGSTGDDVTQLQTALNNAGYNLAVDGIFGSQTQSAVQDYQSKNGLTVDGIVGTNTWGSLNNQSASASNATNATTTAETTAKDTSDYSQYQYDPSTNEAYQNAMNYLNNVKKDSPTFANSYGDQLTDLYNQIVNRDKFSYDINSDMLYQQAKDQYTNLGLQAMQDTVGQGAALTGGYDNSYAQSAGQQQYDAYLQQLNENIPEYYNMALQQYQSEGQDLQNQYSMLSNLDANEYSRYQDDLSNYWQNVNYATNERDTAYDQGYQNFAQAQSFGLQNEQYQYQIQQDNYDKITSLITSVGYNPTDEELSASGLTRAQANALLAAYQASLSSGGSGGGGRSGSGKKSSKVSEEDYTSAYDYYGTMYNAAMRRGSTSDEAKSRAYANTKSKYGETLAEQIISDYVYRTSNR